MTMINDQPPLPVSDMTRLIQAKRLPKKSSKRLLVLGSELAGQEIEQMSIDEKFELLAELEAAEIRSPARAPKS